MRSFRHWTPRYIWNRLALMAHERQHPDLPWLTRAMIENLDTWLRPDDVGLEFGSGRSTIWFAQRVGHLTSVEHHPGWYTTVNDSLQGKRGGVKLTDCVDYHLCEDGSSEGAETNYVHVAKQMKSHSLDFCLIDGVARDHCALASLDKLKPGGILIIDNVNWYIPKAQPSFSPNSRSLKDGYASAVWQTVGEQLQNWRGVWTSNGVTDTAFWVKPPA